jgi:hypothetical protein
LNWLRWRRTSEAALGEVLVEVGTRMMKRRSCGALGERQAYCSRSRRGGGCCGGGGGCSVQRASWGASLQQQLRANCGRKQHATVTVVYLGIQQSSGLHSCIPLLVMATHTSIQGPPSVPACSNQLSVCVFKYFSVGAPPPAFSRAKRHTFPASYPRIPKRHTFPLSLPVLLQALLLLFMIR